MKKPELRIWEIETMGNQMSEQKLMTDLTNKILERANLSNDASTEFEEGIVSENERLMPFIEAQARIIQELMEAMNSIDHENMDPAGPAYGAIAIARRARTNAQEQLQKLVE